MTIILRRPKLGRSSARGIAQLCRNTVSVLRHDRATANSFTGHDLVIRWGCTAGLPSGIRVLNSSEAIHSVNDKALFRRVCQEHSPDLVPYSWFNDDEIQDDSDGVNTTRDFPLVVRPRRHAQGRHLAVVRTFDELEGVIRRAPYNSGYYVSKLINKVSEYRVFVVQGRVACVYNKTPGNPDQVAWNVAQGGRFDHVRWDDWPLQAVRKSIEAFNLSGLDFGGVDVMVDRDGTAYVIEINSAPSLKFNADGTPSHRMTNMAKCFDWIIEHGKETIPLVTQRGGYRKFIHPAICSEALL